MNLYEADIEVWPHSTGRGREVDQQQAGQRHQKYEVKANSFEDALATVNAVIVGVKQNPLVWEVRVRRIEEKSFQSQNRNNLVRCLTERGEAYIK